jgi:hypothetical protein
MVAAIEPKQTELVQPVVLYAELPGPDRKRTPAPYAYRLLHKDLDTQGPTCVMMWEVLGGRLTYQIALERDDVGSLRMHCTCADHVYRGEEEGRFCKHIRGLLDIGRLTLAPSQPVQRVVCVGA